MKRILVCVADDPQAQRTIRVAGEVVKAMGALAIVLHVMPESVYRRIEEEQIRDGVEHPITYSEAEERARLIAEDVAHLLARYGVQYETRGRVGDPAEEILKAAEEEGVDLIVMGFEQLHGLGLVRALGSVSRKVLENTHLPVLIVPALPEGTTHSHA